MQAPPSKWYFPRKRIELESPSRKDGIHLKLENSTRRLALAFGQDVGFMLKMNQYTIATAITYWQRFFMYQSLAKNDPYLIATACMLLAGKVEENFKSLQKITETAYYVRNKKEAAAAERIKKDPKLLVAEMDKVTKAEEVLLVTLDFDFSTSHPHGPLWKVVKDLGLNTKGDRAKEHFCQIAWNFSNDSLRTTLCIQPHSSLDIAIACLNLAATALHYALPASPNGKQWWARFGTSKENLKDIERQLMSLYKRRGEGDSSRTSGLSLPPTPSLPSATAQGLRSTPSPSTGAAMGARAEQAVSAAPAAPQQLSQQGVPWFTPAKSTEPPAVAEEGANFTNGKESASENGLMASSKRGQVTTGGPTDGPAELALCVADKPGAEPASARAAGQGPEGQLPGPSGADKPGGWQAEGAEDKRSLESGGDSLLSKAASAAEQGPSEPHPAEMPQEQEEVEMDVDEAEPAAAPRGTLGGQAQAAPGGSMPAEGVAAALPRAQESNQTSNPEAMEAGRRLQASQMEVDGLHQPGGVDEGVAVERGQVGPEHAGGELVATTQLQDKDGKGDAHARGEEAGESAPGGASSATGGLQGDAQGAARKLGVGQEQTGKGSLVKGAGEGAALPAEKGPAAEPGAAGGNKEAAILEMDPALLDEIETVQLGAPRVAPPGKGPGGERPGTSTMLPAPSMRAAAAYANAAFVDIDANIDIVPVLDSFYAQSCVGPEAAARGKDSSGPETKAPGADGGNLGGELARLGRADKKRSRWDAEREEAAAGSADTSKGGNWPDDGKPARMHACGKGEEAKSSRRAGSRPLSPGGRIRTRSPSPRGMPSPSRSNRSGGASRERTPLGDRDRPRRMSPDSAMAKGGAGRARSPGADRDRHRRSPEGWRRGERRRDSERDDRVHGRDGSHARDSRHRGRGHEQREKERDREREYDRVEGERFRDHKEKHREGERERDRARYPRGHAYH